MAGNLCGSGVNPAIPAQIGAVTSKACGEFPVPPGQAIGCAERKEFLMEAQGMRAPPAGNP